MRYTVEVTRALAARGDLDVHVHCRPDAAGCFRALGLSPRQIHATAPSSTILSSIEEVRGLADVVAAARPDVILGSKHLLPLGDCTARRVLTVHDMLPFDRPGDFGLLKRTILPHQYRRSIRAADVLACVSEATRQRLLHHLPECATAATVVPNAMTSELLHATPESIPELDNRRFALVVGDFSRRKNVGHILEIWPSVIAADPGAVLALVGPTGWGRDQALPQLGPMVQSRKVVLLGHIPEGQLRWAYENACVLLCPSLLEGFGLPVIEAAAFGCPTIVSTDPALTEAADGFGYQVSIADPQGWVDRILGSFHNDRHQYPPAPVPATERTWDDVADELCAAVAATQGATT